MANRTHAQLFLTLLCLAPACRGPGSSTSTDTVLSTPTDVVQTTTTPTTTTPTVAPVEADCSVCDEAFTTGSCMQPTACLDACENAESWSLPIQEAFDSCMLENPLCFMTVDDCVRGELFPGLVVHPVVVNGTDFGFAEGLTLVGGVEGPQQWDILESTVQGGAFVLEFESELRIQASQLFLFYIDLDGSGDCTATDFTGSLFIDVAGPWDAPRYEATVVSSDVNASAFVCQSL